MIELNDEQIAHMVQRFLAWKLPEDFRPDGGITFKAAFNEHTQWPMRHEPSGTNLFDARQAEAMVRYIVAEMPAPSRRPDAPSAGEEFTAVRGVWKNQSLSRLERVRAHRAEFGSDLKRAIEAVDREAEHQRLAALPAPPQADGGEG